MNDIRCPECGSETILRTVIKGPKSGQQFYVCKNFPGCRGRVSERIVEENVTVYGENPPLVKKKNWFLRHPNDLILLSWLFLYILLVIVFAVIQGDSSIYDNPDRRLAICYVAFVIAGMGVTGWGLSLKGRSLWWILLLFIPFGWIFLLALTNKRALSEE